MNYGAFVPSRRVRHLGIEQGLNAVAQMKIVEGHSAPFPVGVTGRRLSSVEADELLSLAQAMPKLKFLFDAKQALSSFIRRLSG